MAQAEYDRTLCVEGKTAGLKGAGMQLCPAQRRFLGKNKLSQLLSEKH